MAFLEQTGNVGFLGAVLMLRASQVGTNPLGRPCHLLDKRVYVALSLRTPPLPPKENMRAWLRQGKAVVQPQTIRRQTRFRRKLRWGFEPDLELLERRTRER